MPHFYTPKGESRFDATPRQAQEEGLHYSVSEQFKVLAKPALAWWLENELAKAAYAEPPAEGESEKDCIRRWRAARYRSTGGPAELGSSIHAEIEKVLLGASIESCPDHLRKFVDPAIRYCEDKGFKADKVEEIVVSNEHGFAGTADMLGHAMGGQPFVLDWKSKKTTPGKTVQPYPENRWQLASYAVALFAQVVTQYGV